MSGMEFIPTVDIVGALLELRFLFKQAVDDIRANSSEELFSLPNGALILILLSDMILERLKGVRALESSNYLSRQSESLLEMELKALKESMEDFQKQTEGVDINEQKSRVKKEDMEKSLTESGLIDILFTIRNSLDEFPQKVEINLPALPKANRLDSTGASYLEYEYAPLPTKTSIRLVSINMNSMDWEDDLHLSFRVVDLDDNPDYVALSYSWKNPCTVFRSQAERDAPAMNKVPLICDGKLLYVGENLYRFLKRWQFGLCNYKPDESSLSEEAKEMSPPREVWIDAVSINQQDNFERSIQVASMGYIYEKCRKCWIWLGEEDEFSRPAMNMITTLATGPHKISMAEKKPQNLDEILGFLKLPRIVSWKWFSIFAFLNRQWFRRSWVVQEASLAPLLVVQCGSLVLPWIGLAAAVSFMRSEGIASQVSNMAFMEMRGIGIEVLFSNDMTRSSHREYERDTSKLNLYAADDLDNRLPMGMLISLMTNSRHANRALMARDYPSFNLGDAEVTRSSSILELWDFSRVTKCIDPKDKIYAFLHLAKRPCYETGHIDSRRRDLVANYDLRTEDVYQEAAWYTLLSGRDLELLSRAGPESGFECLPSWVPDWSTIKNENMLQTYGQRTNLNWSASKSKEWDPPATEFLYESLLLVKGLLIGTICDVTEGEFDYSKGMLLASKLPTSYRTPSGGQSPIEVLWRTLITDFAYDTHPAQHECGAQFEILFWKANKETTAETQYGTINEEKYYRYIHATTAMESHMNENLQPRYWKNPDKPDIDTTECSAKIRTMTSGRQLFRTEQNHLGLGVNELQIDDQIYVLAGATIPFILRPLENGHYKLVGEAYVHGIMHGEGIDGSREFQSLILE